VLLLLLSLLAWLLRRRSRSNSGFVDGFTTFTTSTAGAGAAFDSSAMIGEKGTPAEGSEPDLVLNTLDEGQVATLGNLRVERARSLLSQIGSGGASSPDNMMPTTMADRGKMTFVRASSPLAGDSAAPSNSSRYSSSNSAPSFPLGTAFRSSSLSGLSHGTASETLSSANTSHVRALQDQVSNLQREVELLRQERQVEHRPQRVASPAGTFVSALSAGPPPAYDNLSAVG